MCSELIADMQTVTAPLLGKPLKIRSRVRRLQMQSNHRLPPRNGSRLIAEKNVCFSEAHYRKNMSQLTENKQNGLILIENFEPTACAGKSAQKVETRTRVSTMLTQRQRPCALRHSSGQAGEPAQKVTNLRLWIYGR